MNDDKPEVPQDDLDTSIDWKRVGKWLILPALITVLAVILSVAFPRGF